MKKTVHYYKMDLELTTFKDIKGKETAVKKAIPETEIIKIFQDVQRKLTGNSIRLPYDDKNVFIELLHIDERYAFGKLSNNQDSSTFQIRDEKTQQSSPLPVNPGQSIEIFTYYLISFDTGIISFIFGLSAPRINRLQSVAKLCANPTLNGYSVLITPVPRKNIVDVIKRKSIVGRLTYTYTLPSDDVLSQFLPMEKFDEIDLKQIKHHRITVELKAERNKSFFKDNNVLGVVVDNIHKTFKDRLKSLKVEAKDNDEQLKNYDLLEQNFTYQIDIDINELAPDTIRHELVQSYEKYEDELKTYVRATTQKKE